MIGGYIALTLYVLLVDGVFSADKDEVKTMKEGDSVPLNSGITKEPRDKMLWYFNDTLIVLINVEANKSCKYDGEGGIFKNSLKVDYKTGSLIITNIRSEHAGRYEAELIRSESSGKTKSLNRNSKCDSTKITKKTASLGVTIKTFNVTVNAADPDKPSKEIHMSSSPGVVAGISIGVLVSVAAAQHIVCLY